LEQVMIQRNAARTVVILTGLSACLVVTAGCSNGNTHGGDKPAVAPVKVIVAKPVQQPVTDFVDFTGRTESVESVEIRSRVSGYLTKVAFTEGIDKEVAKDELLFEIDPRPFENSLDAARARKESADASVKTAGAELERTKSVFAKGATTQSDLDRDVGRKAQADADLKGAIVAIKQAELELEFTRITSPVSGRISRPNLTSGNLVTPATGALTTVVSVDPMYVYFDLDEPSLLRIQGNIREGKLASKDEHDYSVLLGLANDHDYPYTGRLDFIDNKVDPQTGTIRVRGVFANPKPERGGRPLTTGLFARVRIPLGASHPALLISERSISRDQGQPFVYVVTPEKEVIYRRVKLGSFHDGLRVIDDGLQAADQVIISGIQRVRPGIKVEAEVKRMVERDGGEK
jgi:RND family efflux transporter MFP subunit